MERKPPRRTRERILELSLRLFNDFGEPNVNTTLIAEEMNISPGNLYYHFKNKDDIINCIFQQFEREADRLLTMARHDLKPNVEDAWLILHLSFELIWKYRFFYRDLNNLLINNRLFETRFKSLLDQKLKMALWLVDGLERSGELNASRTERDALAANMVVVSTYWLSYEYALNPRRFTDPAVVSAALATGCRQVMRLTAPYLSDTSRVLLERLSTEYVKKTSDPNP
jgi:AcrR family transcriptional regulator